MVMARQVYYGCLIQQQMQLRRQSSNAHSISRRTLSSTKFSRAATARERADMASVSKTTMVKVVSTRDRQKKMNNFFDNLTNVFNQSVPRRTHKKHHTAKINLKNKYEQLLLKKSDMAKVLYWNNDAALAALAKIVVSADYIINQDVFWEGNAKNGDERQGETTKSGQRTQNDSMQVTMGKQWRVLHKSHFVIWLIRRKSTWNKLQELVSTLDLPIHAIFYAKKKRNYTINITAVYQEIERSRSRLPDLLNENITSVQLDAIRGQQPAFTFFETVKLNLKDVASYVSYQGRIPVLLGVSVNVVLLRIDGPPPGLEHILKYLSKISRGDGPSELQNPLKYRSARGQPLKIHSLTSIQNYLTQYLLNTRRKELQSSTFGVKQEDFYYEEQEISNRIQEMKRKLIDLLIKEQGRNYQFQGGSSIYNFVGEMFKRNYRILQQNLLAAMQAERRVLKRSEDGWSEHEIMLDLRVSYFEMYLN